MKMDLEMELHNAETSSSAAKRKRKKWNRKSNALCNSNDSNHDCLEGASLMKDIPLQENSCAESIVDKSGLIEAQSNSDLVCSETKKKRKRKQKEKRHNASTTDNTESTVDISSNSDLIKAHNNSSLMCLENKEKRKKQRLEKKPDAPKTDNTDADLQEVTSKTTTDITESTVDISSNSGLIKAHNNSSLMCSKNKKKRKRQQLEKKPDALKTHNTDADIQEVTSKTMTAPFETVTLVDMITKAVPEIAPRKVDTLGDTSTKIEMNTSVDTSPVIHSAQNLSRSQRKNLRKKLRKQGVQILEHDAKDCVLPGDKSLIKYMLSDKDSSLQPSVDISKNELVVKQPSEDVCLFNGHNAPENDRVVTLQMENDKNLDKEDMKKMDSTAAPIDMKASVDTSAVIHSAQNLSRSQRKNLRKKLCKQGAHVLEHDRVVNLEMENDKNLEKEDMKKMDLAASPIDMKASVDRRTMIHSAQNLSRSQRKNLRKKLRKQSVHILECDASKDCILLVDNSLSKNMFAEKDSSFQLSVDICSKIESVVKQSNVDVCLFNGHGSSENNRVIDLQMAKGKHLENKETKPDPKVAELELTTVKEDFPISEKQSGSSNSADIRLMEKDDVHAESCPTLSETRNIVTYKRKKIFKTNIREKKKKCTNSLVNSLDCINEDGDGLMKNVSVLPEGQLKHKERDKLDKIHITVPDASNGDGVSDEIPSHPKDNNISCHDWSCKLPKEQHVDVETKRAETYPPSHLDVIKLGVLHAADKEENHSLTVQSPPKRMCISHSKKKLLVLDVNGILADVVQSPCRRYKPYKMISKKAVFKRPYCDEFLQFCFERFNVGVWSSRIKKNLDKIIDFLIGDSRKNLLFCWHASQCSKTGLNTLGNKKKPLVLKELKKLWEKFETNLPWERGEYNETNTLLLDDSPYKALCNPAHTAIFPYPYDYRNAEDSTLGPGGDLRVYLEGLAVAENVQEYVRQNPFGQRAITERHSSWGFYSKVFHSRPCPPPYYDGDSKVTSAKSNDSHGDSKVTNAKSCEPSDVGNTSSSCQQT